MGHDLIKIRLNRTTREEHLIFFNPASTGVFSLGMSDSKSPSVSKILLSIFAYLNSVMLWMVTIFPAFLVSFLDCWELFQGHRLLLVLPSLLCSTAFSRSYLAFIFILFYFPSVLRLYSKIHLLTSFSLQVNWLKGLVFWPGLSDPFVLRSSREIYA